MTKVSMNTFKRVYKLFLFLIFLTFCGTTLSAKDVDWKKVRVLKDMTFVEYVQSLDLKGQAAIDFWKKIPLSRANRQVNQIFRKEAFAIYMNKYPRASRRVADFKVGMGTTIVGPKSGQKLKLPFTRYSPLPKGPIGDPNKTYRIGYTIHGFGHPWLLNNADSAIWEANRHSNVRLTVLDPEFNNEKQVQQIDRWIQEKYDGILIWPMQEAPTGPPVNRAAAKNITTVSVDRMVGSRKVSAHITGNFPANGAQQGMYLIHKLLQETKKVKGNILMIRKPLGSTADAMRTGHFLKVVSYFPELKILGSHHNASNRQDSYKQVTRALKDHSEIDVVFCTGAEQGMGAVLAIDKAKRWNSRKGNRRIIVLNNDDLHEALMAMQNNKMAMTAPYTPLLGALGIRVLLKKISGEKIPQGITTPDLPMITKNKETVFGLETISVKEWLPYAYGKK